MSRFLSPEWLDELAAAAAGGVGPESPPFSLQQVVRTDGGDDHGDGEVCWSVVVGDGKVSVQPGRSDDATVTFTQDRATAASILRGELSAQAAFMTGRLRVGGDVRLLLEHQAALTALDDVFAGVRATTTY